MIEKNDFGTSPPAVPRPSSTKPILSKTKAGRSEPGPAGFIRWWCPEVTQKARHPDIATSLTNLACLYFASTRGKMARLPPFHRVLGIRNKVQVPDHPGVATSLDHSVRFDQAQGETTPPSRSPACPVHPRQGSGPLPPLGTTSPDSTGTHKNSKAETVAFTRQRKPCVLLRSESLRRMDA